MSGVGPCVGCRSKRCKTPATLSVTFSGLSDVVQVSSAGNQFRILGWSLVSKSLTVVGTGPGALLGDTTGASRGPVSGIRTFPFSSGIPVGNNVFEPSLDAGTGFAVLGRAEPTIRAYVNNTGHGATFSGTLSSTTDLNGLPIWTVSSISIGGNGYGYTHNSQITALVGEGSICYGSLLARLLVRRGEPTLNATVPAVSPCSCATPGAHNGWGAVFALSYQQTSSAPGSETWSLASVDVVDGGKGYTNGLALQFSAGEADVLSATPQATIVTQNGVITSVQLQSGGVAYKQGVPASVTIQGGGAYYKEDQSLPPHVCTPTVLYSVSNPPLPADRPAFEITIDSTTGSETFGHVTKVELTDAGDDCLAWFEAKTCFSELNGVPFVLRNQPLTAEDPAGEPAVLLCASSSFGFPPTLQAKTPSPHDFLNTALPDVTITNNGNLLAYLARVEPSVSVSGGGGTGAKFSVYWERQAYVGIPHWQIATVDADGGSGYTDNALLSVSLSTSSDKQDSAAQLRIRTKRYEPDVSITTACQSRGAVFEATWRDNGDTPRTFGLHRVKVVSGGAGYVGNVPLTVAVKSGSTQVAAACAVALTEGGKVTSVDVRTPGKYYRSTTEAGSVTVEDGGIYYRNTDDVVVAAVDVEVYNRQLEFGGAGAEVSVVVDQDPSSPTFGRVTSASIDDAGSDYILRRNYNSFFSTTCELTSPLPLPPFAVLPIRCWLQFDPGSCLPVLVLSQGNTRLVFAAEYGDPAFLSDDSRSLTLYPVLPGNTGHAVIEWGGVFDAEDRVCSCCDLSLERCEDPPDSGWPVGEGEASGSYVDPFGLVFPRSCAGTNANGDFVDPNGGTLLWTAVYDENGDFVSWQLLCGTCTEAIFIDLDQNGDPIYSATPEPTTVVTTRGTKGRTACSCFPFDAGQGCLWEPEVGEDGCWTGQYVVASISCENPLP